MVCKVLRSRSLLFVSMFLGLNTEEYSMVWQEECGLGMKAGLAWGLSHHFPVDDRPVPETSCIPIFMSAAGG